MSPGRGSVEPSEDEPAALDHGDDQRSLRRLLHAPRAPQAGFEVLLVLVAVAIGYVVAGITGALVAGSAMVAGRLPSERPGAAVAMAACVLLAGAALATVLVDLPGRTPVSLAYPLRRELASDLGAAAGILLFAAIVTAGRAERSREPAPAASSPGRAEEPSRRWSMAMALVAGSVVLVTSVVRLLGAPAALPASLQPVVEAVASGRALVAEPVGLVAPAAPVLAALAPGGAQGVLVGVGVGVVALVWLLAQRGSGRTVTEGVPGGPKAAISAAAVAAVLPALWLLDLRSALVAAAAVGVVLLADPREVNLTRGAMAGLLAGGAVLARPDAVVLAPVAATWLLVAFRRGGRPSRRQVRAAWVVMAAWLVVLACWASVVHGQTASWNPLVTAGPSGDLDVAAIVVVAALVVNLVAIGLAGSLLRGRPTDLVSLLPLVVLPVWASASAALGGFDPARLRSWGAPFVAVLAGWRLASCKPLDRVGATWSSDQEESRTSR